jgi:hypothetical protein
VQKLTWDLTTGISEAQAEISRLSEQPVLSTQEAFSLSLARMRLHEYELLSEKMKLYEQLEKLSRSRSRILVRIAEGCYRKMSRWMSMWPPWLQGLSAYITVVAVFCLGPLLPAIMVACIVETYRHLP